MTDVAEEEPETTAVVSEEFKVTYRREGGKTQYRLFQKKAMATSFLAKVQKEAGYAPLVRLSLEARPCGAWYGLEILSEGTSKISGKVGTQ
jgi:hypothetical protein